MVVNYKIKKYIHTICVPRPHISSYAAYILLYKYYAKQEKRARVAFKKRLIKERCNGGDIKCTYCGKKMILKVNNKNDNINHLLTLDHRIPKSVTGRYGDPRNILFACYKCNLAKGVMDEDEFRRRLIMSAIKNKAWGRIRIFFVKYILFLIEKIYNMLLMNDKEKKDCNEC